MYFDKSIHTTGIKNGLIVLMVFAYLFMLITNSIAAYSESSINDMAYNDIKFSPAIGLSEEPNYLCWVARTDDQWMICRYDICKKETMEWKLPFHCGEEYYTYMLTLIPHKTQFDYIIIAISLIDTLPSEIYGIIVTQDKLYSEHILDFNSLDISRTVETGSQDMFFSDNNLFYRNQYGLCQKLDFDTGYLSIYSHWPLDENGFGDYLQCECDDKVSFVEPWYCRIKQINLFLKESEKRCNIPLHLVDMWKYAAIWYQWKDSTSIYLCINEQIYQYGLYVYDISANSLEALYDGSGNDIILYGDYDRSAVRFSPDGRYLAYFSATDDYYGAGCLVVQSISSNSAEIIFEDYSENGKAIHESLLWD